VANGLNQNWSALCTVWTGPPQRPKRPKKPDKARHNAWRPHDGHRRRPRPRLARHGDPRVTPRHGRAFPEDRLNPGALGPAASGLGVRTSYTLDALNRVTSYLHIDVAKTAVTKRTDYAYRPDGSVGTVTRFAETMAAPPGFVGPMPLNPIGTSTAAYDSLGRLTGIAHAPSASPAITYGYAYDAASRITSMTTPEGTSSFTLDATDQLMSASLTGETYAYDKTGNRTSGNAVTGTGNRLLSDGTYRYAYDAEGNRTAKFVDTNAGGTLSVGDTDVTLYAYDQRNRLVAVSHVTAWTATQAAELGAFTVSGTPPGPARTLGNLGWRGKPVFAMIGFVRSSPRSLRWRYSGGKGYQCRSGHGCQKHSGGVYRPAGSSIAHQPPAPSWGPGGHLHHGGHRRRGRAAGDRAVGEKQ